MKNKALKRIFSVAMVAVMLLGMVGCGGNGGGITQPTGDWGSNVGPGNIDINAETGTVTYPIKTDDTLTIWCGRGYGDVYSGYKDYTESPWHTGLVGKTGVEVVWQYPVSGAQNEQAYNLLLTKDVLPDIICYPCAPSDGKMLMDEGAIMDLTEYLPKYAPDYWKYITKEGNEDLLRAVTTPDGKIYYIGSFRETRYNCTVYGPIVRKDWLDECNLGIPETMEDWEVMLNTFKTKYGAKFAYPSSRFSGAGLASGFGAYGGTTARMYLDNGEIKFAATQPEYKEYLATLSRWVKEGLMDVDSLTMSDEAFRTKCLNNNCGAGFTVMSNFTEIINDAEYSENGAEWIAVPYPVPEKGQAPTWVATSARADGTGCVITTSCSEEKIATALKWLNYPYTEEGILYCCFGEENDTYVINEEGKPVFTDKVLRDPEGSGAAFYKYTSHGDQGYAGLTTEQFLYTKNHPTVAEGVNTWIGESKSYDTLVPTMYYTTKENIRYSDLYLTFGTYINEMTQRIIAGDTSIDQFDTIVDRCYELGLQEALDIINAAYQRYLNGQ